MQIACALVRIRTMPGRERPPSKQRRRGGALRESLWLAAALAFGLVALPLLVHLTGEHTLGAYAGGDARRFLRDFYADLVRLRPAALLLAVGPLAFVLTWRMLLRLILAR